MNGSPWPRIAVGVALFAALLLVAALVETDGFQPTTRGKEPVGVAVVKPLEPELEDPMDPAGVEPSAPVALAKVSERGPVATGQRSAALASLLAGRLVDEAGEPVAGAHVSWTSFNSEWLLPLSGWQDLSERWASDDWVEARTVHTRSDARGNFEFEGPPPSIAEKDSVIWVTCPGFQAQQLLFTAGPEQEVERPIVMERAPPIRVRVLSATGKGVPQATLREIALVPPTKQLNTPLPPEVAVRLFLRREAFSEETGWATLPSLPGQLALQAAFEEQRSPTWTGQARPEVHLQLSPTFRVGGRLTITDDTIPHPQETSVSIEAWRAGIPRLLQRVNVDNETREWGPVTLPLADFSRYSFTLNAYQVTASTRSIDPPEPGAELTIDFEGSEGNSIWFGLVDSAGEPLKQGLVEVFWEGAEGPESIAMKLMEDGFTNTSAVPDGQVTSWRGSAPGYAMNHGGGFALPQPVEGTHYMTLLPAGRLAGRCVFEGEPVQEFEVVLWPTEDPAKVSKQRILGSTDGSFVIEEAPLGAVQVLALAGGHGPSSPVHVTIARETQTEVELLLRTPNAAAGRVVDELGEPMPGATVQAYVGNDRQLLAPQGAPLQTDFQGAFQLAELAAGRSALRVTAPGYSPREKWLHAEPNGTTEIGVIRMSPLRDLLVRVIPAGKADMTQYQVSISLNSIDQVAYRPLSSDGTALFRNTNVDTRYAYLALPDATLIGWRVPKPTAREWVAEYHIGGSGAALIDIDRSSHPGPLDPTLKINLDSYARGPDSFVRTAEVPAQGEALIEDLAPGKYLVRVANNSVQTPGSTVITIKPGETTRATVRFDGKPSSFRIVDKHGQPLAGVTLSLYDATYPLWRQAVSNTGGLCTISGTPAIECFAGLQHHEWGNLWGVPVTLGRGLEEVIELEFRAEGSLRLRLIDGETPLENVECRLTTSDNREVGVGFPRDSNASGEIVFEHLGPATYTAAFRGPEVWPTRTSLIAKESAKEVSVPLRRVGDLSFSVSRADSSPVSGVSIQLVSIDLGESAEEWIAEGKLMTAPASTATDSAGSLIFPAIPHGSYRWEIHLAGGDVLAGEVHLAPGAQTSVSIEWP